MNGCIKALSCFQQIVKAVAVRASAFDTGASILLWVVTGVPLALRNDTLPNRDLLYELADEAGNSEGALDFRWRVAEAKPVPLFNESGGREVAALALAGRL